MENLLGIKLIQKSMQSFKNLALDKNSELQKGSTYVVISTM